VADEKITISIEGDSSKLQSELKKATNSTEDFSKGVTRTGDSAAKTFAILATGFNQAFELAKKLGSALQGPIEAFREQQLASEQLRVSLVNQGLDAEKLSTQYKNVAKALQEKTGVDDDAIVKSLALLQSFIGQQKISKELAGTLVDLAEREGSLEGAATLLGRAINGQTKGLNKYSIELDNVSTRADRTALLIEKFGTRVGGAAEAANQGLGGLRGLQSSFSDLLETVGEKFSPVITQAIKELTRISKAVGEDKDLQIFFEDVAKAAQLFLNALLKVEKGLTKLIKLNNEVVDAAGKDLFSFFRSDEDKKADDALAQAAARSRAKLRAAGVPDRPRAVVTAEEREEAAPKAPATQSPEAAQAEADLTAREQAALEEQKFFQEQTLAQNAEFQALDTDQRREFLRVNQEELLKAQQTAAENQDAAAKQSLNRDIASQNQRLEAIRRYHKFYLDLESLFNAQQLEGAGRAANALVGLQNSKIGVLKSIGKAAAIYQIQITTRAAAVDAFEGTLKFFSFLGPFAYAPAIAAGGAALAYGAEQIAGVLSAQEGGLVPGLNQGFDAVPALLQPGELIIPRNNAAEVLTAVADQRAAAERTLPGEVSVQQSPMGVEIGFNGAEAEKVLTARRVEARSLGILREATA
jgi:hypothetical protein